MDSRIFVGVYPTGIFYADRQCQRSGDYARLAFLSFDTLELTLEPDCWPEELRKQIIDHAALIQARKGERFQVSTAGQTVLLGSRAK
jgi:hypothetical protein